MSEWPALFFPLLGFFETLASCRVMYHSSHLRSPYLWLILLLRTQQPTASLAVSNSLFVHRSYTNMVASRPISVQEPNSYNGSFLSQKGDLFYVKINEVIFQELSGSLQSANGWKTHSAKRQATIENLWFARSTPRIMATQRFLAYYHAGKGVL